MALEDLPVVGRVGRLSVFYPSGYSVRLDGAALRVLPLDGIHDYRIVVVTATAADSEPFASEIAKGKSIVFVIDPRCVVQIEKERIYGPRTFPDTLPGTMVKWLADHPEWDPVR